MSQFQNYTTVDSYKPSKTTVIRVSEIHEALSNTKNPKSALVPVAQDQPHFVVAEYQSGNWSRTTQNHIELRSSELIACEHFIGTTAEGDAMAFYLGLVDPDEFSPKELNCENYPSYQPDRRFPKPEEE